MLEVLVNDLVEGMILQGDVLSKSGTVLLYGGMMLDIGSIRKLKISGIKTVIVSSGLTDVNVEGIAQLSDGEEVSFDPENTEIEETIYTKEFKETEQKAEELSLIVKESILNLNLNKKDLDKNCHEASSFIKDNFSKNPGNTVGSILTVREVDEYLYRHSMNVAILSFMIGRWLGYSEERLNKLVKAALLHDIGKLKIPKHILNKPGKLTDEEFKIMKTHSKLTYDFLIEKGEKDIDVIQGAVFHHEKLDGTGYPSGISGNKVHEFARIISIADIFDAMTSERVYKKKSSIFKVLELFEEQSFGSLDTKITLLLIKKLLEFYIGANVILNDGSPAKIIRLNISETMKPLVMKKEGTFIDMTKSRNIKIEDFLLKNGQPVFA